MKMIRKSLTVLLVLMTIIGFSKSQTGMEYYSAAELSYKSGDYKTALDNYEMALTADNTLEGYDPQIKFKMGISAYMIGNYDKARNYLAGYDNDFVKSLLESISSRQAEDEWKRWIKQNTPTTPDAASQVEVSTSVAVTQTSNRNSNIAIVIVIFSTTFAVLMITEFRIYRMKRKVIELPLKSRQETSAQKVESEIGSIDLASTFETLDKNVQSPGEVEDTTIEKTPSELDLIPNGAKIIDFEELINSEIDVFKDIFEQLDIIDKNKEEISEKSDESQKSKGSSEVLGDTGSTIEPPAEEMNREELINEVLDESKDLIEEMKKISEEFSDVEQKQITPIEVEGMEAELIGRVKKVRSTISKDKYKETESEEQPVEDYEKLQKTFEEFDELHTISEEDADVLVKKLIILSRGEKD